MREKSNTAPAWKKLPSVIKLGSTTTRFVLRRTNKFLAQGHKVKMTVRLRGREAQHSNLAIDLLRRFAKDVEEISIFEREPKLEGYRIIMILAPKKENK